MSNTKTKKNGKLNPTEKIYVVYKTTNLITKQEYIGVFSYHPLKAKDVYKEMHYIGQGAINKSQVENMKPTEFLKNVIQYGFENFKREDILLTNDADAAYDLEASLVNIDWVDSPMTLNQMCGGKKPKWGKLAKKRKSQSVLSYKNPAAKPVVDEETGKIYGCIKDCAEALDLSYDGLKRALRNNTHPTISYLLNE